MFNVLIWNEIFRKQKGVDDVDIWVIFCDSCEVKIGVDEKFLRFFFGLDEKILCMQVFSLLYFLISVRKIFNVYIGILSGIKLGMILLIEILNDVFLKFFINLSVMEQGINFYCVSFSNLKELKKGDVDSSYKKDEDVVWGLNQSY